MKRKTVFRSCKSVTLSNSQFKNPSSQTFVIMLNADGHQDAFKKAQREMNCWIKRTRDYCKDKSPMAYIKAEACSLLASQSIDEVYGSTGHRRFEWHTIPSSLTLSIVYGAQLVASCLVLLFRRSVLCHDQHLFLVHNEWSTAGALYISQQLHHQFSPQTQRRIQQSCGRQLDEPHKLSIVRRRTGI